MKTINPENWDNRLAQDFPKLSAAIRESIVRWLMGNSEQATSSSSSLEHIEQMREYRYRILQQRYLEVNSTRAFRNLITRLASSVVLRNKIRAWVAVSRDRKRTVIDVLEEVIQELLQGDRHLEEEIKWIAECTANRTLRNAMLLTAAEEYCLRPIQNQPLIAYRFINYMKLTTRGGLTYIPSKESIRIVSHEVINDDNDNFVSLVDYQSNNQENNPQHIQGKEDIQTVVQEQFAQYLESHIGPNAKEWLKLYLQGYKPNEIAQALNLSSQQVFRLREKIAYHAKNIFSSKLHPELISDWLDAS
jgi:hypothetical protein